MTQHTGTMIVLTGPSGVGKGVLRQCIATALPGLKASVSVTTRPMRPGEADGVDYFFVTSQRFQEMIAQGDLLEWAEFAGHYYGTPKSGLQHAMDQGSSILLEIEVQGALQVKQLFPQAHLIFVAPPSMEALEARLRERNTNDEADIQARLAQASEELAAKDQFDIVLINDDLSECQETLLQLIRHYLSLTVDVKGHNANIL